MSDELPTEELEKLEDYLKVSEERNLLREHNEVLNAKVGLLEARLENMDAEINSNRRRVKDINYGVILLGLVFSPIIFAMTVSNLVQIKVSSGGQYEVQTTAFPFEKLGMVTSAILGTGGLIVGNKKGLKKLLRRDDD